MVGWSVGQFLQAEQDIALQKTSSEGRVEQPAEQHYVLSPCPRPPYQDGLTKKLDKTKLQPQYLSLVDW